MTIALIVPGGVNARVGHVVPCLVWLIERLARRHTVVVFALFHEPQPSSWSLHGARVLNIGSDPGWRKRLFRTIDAVHASTPFDVIHAFWAGPGLYAVLAGWRHRVPVVTHCAGGELVGDAHIGYGSRLTWRGRASTRVALAGARRVTVATEYMVRLAARLGVDADLVPLGVALDRWPPRLPQPRQPSRPLQLLHIGDLRPVKDQMTLIDAVARLRSRGCACHLHMVGVDHLDGQVQRRAAELGLGDHSTWHGLLSREPLRTVVNNSDLMVMSSRHEAGPLAVLEAAVAGVPSVGTAVGQIADWASTAAVAVPVGDAEAMAREIEALDRDEPRRLRLASEALRRATACDADDTARRFDAIYAAVTGGHA
jgi:glycosyltransferase involved in cell wall biosynthesis